MVWVTSQGPNTNCPNRIVYIYPCYIKIWGTSGFCTWPYFTYYVHNPSWEHNVSVSKETAISCLEACIKDIKIWMTNNLLKLNDNKTEVIVIITHSNTSQNQHIGINIGDSLITPSSERPRNLGVLFDSKCSLHDHVSKIRKSINYNLYSIRKIRKYHDTTTAEKMINCSITSRLDYCNSLLYGAKGYNISQLQLCQNNAARMLSLRRKFDHITPVLKDLHWLPVEQRI